VAAAEAALEVGARVLVAERGLADAGEEGDRRREHTHFGQKSPSVPVKAQTSVQTAIAIAEKPAWRAASRRSARRSGSSGCRSGSRSSASARAPRVRAA